MAKVYNWRLSSSIISGGYSGEETGVIPPDTGWRSTDVMSGSSSAEYYYRDSDTGDNNNSSRVVVAISESWTASISNKNYLSVTLTTQITSIRRDDIRGTPGSTPRNIRIRRSAGGTVLASFLNDPVNTAHTISSSPIVLDSYTFTLAPGQNLSRGSVYFRNNTVGYDDVAVPNIYVDEMWLGTEFKNTLPKDYIPGKVWDGSDWLSHNRDTNGHAKVYMGSAWSDDMKTIDGPDDTGDPPEIWHDSSTIKNMRKIGTGA